MRRRTPLAQAVTDHITVFAKIYADKHIALESDVSPLLSVACETQDVDEMLGNVIDNACKWSRHRVRITARLADKTVHLQIDDDGPGLTTAQAIGVLKPGKRLDEGSPGYGFGLPITEELAELYGGALSFHTSSLGGLQVTLVLPAAP